MKTSEFFFFFFWVGSGHRWGQRRIGEIKTYLDLIGDDGTRTELCANLVCPDRIKVYETESLDVTVALDVLEVAQTSHITLIGVVLPIKLHGDWASKGMCVSWTDRWHGRKRKV